MNIQEKNKIVFVTGIYPLFKGGAEYQMRLIADCLKDDYEIVFLYLGDIPGHIIKETRVEIIDGYKTYFIKSPTKWDAFTLKYTYGKRVYEVLKKEKPNFVYQRVLKFMSYYISKYQQELGYQHFIHVADLFTLQFKTNSLRGKFNYHFFKKTVANESQFIVQTGEQEKALQQLSVKPILQVYNMHPSLETSILPYIEKKLECKIYHIVWVANIKPIKQLEIFVSLAERFIDNPTFHFDLIGSIQDPDYAHPILERMSRLNNITHYQGKDNSFVNEFLLNHANLVINTSISEGFSNVFIQSWMRGVPVVSLNSDPDQIFVKYPILGACTYSNIEQLKDQILQLLKNKNYLKNSLDCFEISTKLFSFENITRIKQLLEKK